MHASKSALPVEKLGNSHETRLADWGEYMAYFEHMPAGIDYSEFYDNCDCPHLGYVFSGKMRFVYRDGREEIVGAGEMYFAHSGHAFQVLEDTDTVEFSPSGPYRKHMEAVAARIAAASRGDT